jgi:acetyl esterase/lipase
VTSRHLVDPELLPALDMLPAYELTLETLPKMRAQLKEMYAHLGANLPAASQIERRERLVPGPKDAPDVRVLVYTHKDGGDGRPAYLYIHGGGFVMGTAGMAESSNRALAAELGCVIVAVDYRLAPETIFPGNVEDCYAALKWLYAHAAALDADPNRIAIGGESAGGTLTAALALLARDRKEVPIIHQQLVYPGLDDRTASIPDSHPYTGEFGWTRERSHFAWKSILGHEPGGPGVSPYAAPARAERLEGLPPAFIGIGSLDLSLEQNLEYARRLTRAGVPVELHVYPGAYHGSDMMTEARLSKMHARDQLEALRAAFDRVRQIMTQV